MERNIRFFGAQFEIVILEIQTKYIDDKSVLDTEIDSQKQRIELLERNTLDQEKRICGMIKIYIDLFTLLSVFALYDWN